MEINRFRQQYRIQSSRYAVWDYSQSGMYFVTICTQGMRCWFGTVQKGRMLVNAIGVIAAEEWMKTQIIRSDTVVLDQWVIMPNHIHGIIGLKSKLVETPQRGVSTHKNWQDNSLGSIVNQFKGVVTKRIHVFEPEFAWQPRYYDRIIRNEAELQRIRDYIYYNPVKWEIEKSSVENIQL